LPLDVFYAENWRFAQHIANSVQTCLKMLLSG